MSQPHDDKQCSQLIVGHHAGASGHGHLCTLPAVTFAGGQWWCARHSPAAVQKRYEERKQREEARMTKPHDDKPQNLSSLSSTDRERKYREALEALERLLYAVNGINQGGLPITSEEMAETNRDCQEVHRRLSALPTEQEGWLRTGNEARPALEAAQFVVGTGHIHEVPIAEFFRRAQVAARALLASEARPVTRNDVLEALRLILPMAKGYAAEHPVGNNAAFVAEAERALKREGDAPSDAKGEMK